MKRILTFALLMSSAAGFANAEIDAMKLQIRELQKKTGGQHLNFNVDYRVTMDELEYKMVSGTKYQSHNLLSSRLLLNMGYKYNDNLSFKGALGYNKAFGDTANHDQRNESGTANFDWITNENLSDNTIKVKEAYFLYKNDTFLGINKLPWSFSIGRRPSTNGFLGNNREGFEAAKSPLAHSINVEFDGLSWKLELDKLTGVSGMDFKVCAGRGLTNAKSRFDSTGVDYSYDNSKTDNIDMVGFIYTPYNDGQYNLKAQVFHATNMIGIQADNMGVPLSNDFKDFGDLNNVTVSMEVNGIGDMINDYLDGVRVFGSYSMSETDPSKGMYMLGSDKKQKGHSYWAGVTLPGLFKDGESFGLEFNQGSKYWRSFTYGEDTLVGSKMAARGKAYEAYYNLPLIDQALTFQLRYTYIKYDYTGSNGFFGNYSGTPVSMTDMKAMNGMNPAKDAVESAQALRATLRYQF